LETQGRSIVFSSDQNGTNPRFPDFARNANLLVMHLAIGVGANNPNQALPAMVGQSRAERNPGRLVLTTSHNSISIAAIVDVKKSYTGPLTIARRSAVHPSAVIAGRSFFLLTPPLCRLSKMRRVFLPMLPAKISALTITLSPARK